MVYFLFIITAALATAAILFLGSRKGVVDTGLWKLYKPCEEEITPFRGKGLILLILVCFVIMVAAQISLYSNTSVINLVKLAGLMVLVLGAAVVDAKRRIIPNVLILAGLVFRAGIYVYEFLCKAEELKAIFTNDMIGFAIGFLFLAVVSLISKGALGFGDVKLFGVIGLISGSFCTYSTLFLSLVISVVVSLVSISRKKMGRKDSFPFGPCIAAGYTLAVLLTSY